MESNDAITRSITKFVTGENVHICRLCFVNTRNETTYSFENFVKLEKEYYNDEVSFGQMFEELGIMVENKSPNSICNNCAASTINSFMFLKQCQFSDSKWLECLDFIESDLSRINTLDTTIKTAFILLGKEMLTCKKDNIITKEAAANKIKKLKFNKIRYERKKEECLDAICEECGEHCTTKIALEKHRKLHKSKLRCPVCAKLFSTRIKLQDHNERIHKPKTIPCDKCDFKFSSIKMLKAHEKSNHMACVCKLCFIQFPSKLALRNHLNRHEVLQCSNCEKSFINKLSFQAHSKSCNQKEERSLQFFCDMCGKGYFRKHSLRSHIKTDHGYGVLYHCNWCNKKYDAQSKLKNHIVKHTRERNFICQHCGGKFVTKAALVYHTRLHTGEKPYQCPHCSESFLSASRKMQHIRRKHLEPTKQCQYCQAKFPTNTQLRVHQKRHFNPQSKCYIPPLELSGTAIEDVN